jgi:hypothetical protein
MAGVKITTTDLIQPTQIITNAQGINPVANTTNTLDGFIQILTRVERIVNSPTIQPFVKKAFEKWEERNGLNEQPIQQEQVYNNPQVWEAPKQAEQPKQTEAPKTTEQPATAKFTPEQLKKYFPTEDDVISFIEKLLNILPDDITTQEVALFIQEYIGQLPNEKIKIIKPIFGATKPLIKKQLAPIYAQANTGGKGAEKGGLNGKTNNKTTNAKN